MRTPAKVLPIIEEELERSVQPPGLPLPHLGQIRCSVLLRDGVHAVVLAADAGPEHAAPAGRAVPAAVRPVRALVAGHLRPRTAEGCERMIKSKAFYDGFKWDCVSSKFAASFLCP